MAGNRDDGSTAGRHLFRRAPPSDSRARFLIRARENEVPYINVKLIEGVFTPQQKREIAERLTETMVDIEGENMREVTTVVIDETKSGDWSIGGRCLSTEDVRALAAGSGAGIAQ
jgi:4-oxalocrotonate tautomerase